MKPDSATEAAFMPTISVWSWPLLELVAGVPNGDSTSSASIVSPPSEKINSSPLMLCATALLKRRRVLLVEIRALFGQGGDIRDPFPWQRMANSIWIDSDPGQSQVS